MPQATATLRITEERTFSAHLGDRTITGLAVASTWEGFTKYTNAAGAHLIVLDAEQRVVTASPDLIAQPQTAHPEREPYAKAATLRNKGFALRSDLPEITGLSSEQIAAALRAKRMPAPVRVSDGHGGITFAWDIPLLQAWSSLYNLSSFLRISQASVDSCAITAATTAGSTAPPNTSPQMI